MGNIAVINLLTMLQSFGADLFVFTIRVGHCSDVDESYVERSVKEDYPYWYVLLACDVQPMGSLTRRSIQVRVSTSSRAMCGLLSKEVMYSRSIEVCTINTDGMTFLKCTSCGIFNGPPVSHIILTAPPE